MGITMGRYVNPGNQAFKRITASDYVDKTELIGLMNARLGRADSFVCVSRPRRFGKSYAAKMLTAYYDCSCDSHALFDDKAIAAAKDYEVHMNGYFPRKLVQTLKRLKHGMSVRKYVASRPESGGSKRQSKKNVVVCYKYCAQ